MKSNCWLELGRVETRMVKAMKNLLRVTMTARLGKVQPSNTSIEVSEIRYSRLGNF